MSVIRYDVISFLFICVLLPLLFLIAKNHLASAEWSSLWNGFAADDARVVLPPHFIASLIILTMFTYILAPWYGQKIFAARSKRTAKVSVALAAVIVFLLYGCAVIATASLRYRGTQIPMADTALPYFVVHELPNGLRGLFYGLFFFAGATTLAGVWGAMSSMLIGDFLNKKKQSGLFRAWSTTLLFALLCWLGANLFVDKIFQNLILANIPVAALSFALLAGFYWKGASPWGAYASTFVGVAWGVGCYFYFGEAGGYTWYWAAYGVPLIFFVGFMGSWAEKRLKTMPKMLIIPH